MTCLYLQHHVPYTVQATQAASKPPLITVEAVRAAVLKAAQGLLSQRGGTQSAPLASSTSPVISCLLAVQQAACDALGLDSLPQCMLGLAESSDPGLNRTLDELCQQQIGPSKAAGAETGAGTESQEVPLASAGEGG